MKRAWKSILMAVVFALALHAGQAAALPDRYIGDTAIYSGNSQYIQPNVLFIIDNNVTMENQAGSGSPYNPNLAYAGPYSTWSVYKLTGQANYVQHIVPASQTQAAFQAAVTCTEARTALLAYGTYSGGANTGLKSQGTCGAGGAGTVYLGNLLNYNVQPSGTPISGTVSVVNGSSDVVGTGTLFSTELLVGDSVQIDNVVYSVAAIADATHLTIIPPPSTPPNPPNTGVTSPTSSGLSVVKPADTTPQIALLRDAIAAVVGGSRSAVRFGMMVFGSNNKGGRIVSPVDLIDDVEYTNFASLLNGNIVNGVEGVITSGGNSRPFAEALYDAGAYYRGVATLPISGAASSASPLQYSCQKNFVILITNGDTIGDGSPILSSMPSAPGFSDGDVDGDGREPESFGNGSHYLDDVAKYLYDSDTSTTMEGIQRISTHTVLVFSPYKELVERAADGNHGHGTYRLASNASQLRQALEDAVANIVNSVDTAFVAPVVPVSPENRSYSANRIYLGFFKPISQKYWIGNIKKFGIDSGNNIVGTDPDIAGTIKREDFATYEDKDEDGRDDRDNELLPGGFISGQFRPETKSFWLPSGDLPDAGIVDQGGVGRQLITRNYTLYPRKVYTYLPSVPGATLNLNAPENRFDTSNALLTAEMLGVSGAFDPALARQRLIDFVLGHDSYDEGGVSGNRTELRTWFMGDVLHSRPAIVHYRNFAATQESDPAVNRTMIFAGGNDGMLHAFWDANGMEAWSFIPTEMLANLWYMTTTVHTYLVDGSPVVYIFDKNKNGVIEAASPPGVNDDRVILFIGFRRGSSDYNSTAKGWYYALDVTNPEAPVVLWRRATGYAGLTQLGETWSDINVGKMKIGSDDKIVAVFGAGYDNCNEDSRFGNTAYWKGSCLIDNDAGIAVSAGAAGNLPYIPKGRGLFVVQVGTLNSNGSLDTTGFGQMLWSYGNSADMTVNDTNMKHSIPSQITLIDSDFDGFVDRFYAGDTGGFLWRFDVGSSLIGDWSGRRIFSANPLAAGNTDTGRKIFYSPSVTIEVGYSMVFVGTGDREHPLNRSVIDRMYAVADRGQTTMKSETDLEDVTIDVLQAGTNTEADQILARLVSTSNYGWFIKLDGGDRDPPEANPGEKVLSSPTVFNGVAYFTTYGPNVQALADPCAPGNLGSAAVYALNYRTGEAVLNYDTTNDTYSTSNTRATPPGGGVLLRSDRKMKLGQGIPSGVVLWIGPPAVDTDGDGDVDADDAPGGDGGGPGGGAGAGGGISGGFLGGGGDIIPVYWRQK